MMEIPTSSKLMNAFVALSYALFLCFRCFVRWELALGKERNKRCAPGDIPGAVSILHRVHLKFKDFKHLISISLA